ncbi:DUF1996 domain-containing protein [Streptomyces sp. MS06]|uniref:DUF1996 domain-containing protein n=1 Tax=Streptomyces sp. MS06 TaxID=3385974 RepID=UPI0039A2C72C
MRASPRPLPALLLGATLLTGALGTGALGTGALGTGALGTGAPGTGAPGGTGPASSADGVHAAQVSAQVSGDDPDGDGYILADPQVTGVTPSTANPPPRYFHEFQANCAVSHTGPDDPIVFPGLPGASHDHTFLGNTSTDAYSTTASLDGGDTACKAPADASAYWMPSLYDGDRKVLPAGPQVIYYKAGVTDYTSVRPFPKGLRFIVGNPLQGPDGFRDNPGWVEGWECGNSYKNVDFPADCPAGTQLNIRMQAPSCWDGKYLDTPDHRSHMAYPVVKPGTNDNVCPADHPVAVPMIEFKMAFPVDGDMSQVHLASGRGYTFHYDFINAWGDRTLKALVDHCIVGGLQCDAHGYDQTHPEEGAALNSDYRLP